MDTQQILEENQDLFSTFCNPILTGLRFIGWWIIRGLTFLNEKVEDINQNRCFRSGLSIYFTEG